LTSTCGDVFGNKDFPDSPLPRGVHSRGLFRPSPVYLVTPPLTRSEKSTFSPPFPFTPFKTRLPFLDSFSFSFLYSHHPFSCKEKGSFSSFRFSPEGFCVSFIKVVTLGPLFVRDDPPGRVGLVIGICQTLSPHFSPPCIHPFLNELCSVSPSLRSGELSLPLPFPPCPVEPSFFASDAISLSRAVSPVDGHVSGGTPWSSTLPAIFDSPLAKHIFLPSLT